MKSHLPQTGTADFLELLSPFVPDDYLDQHWPRLKTGGRHYGFSASQLWRMHLLVLITPVHSLNLLIRLLPEQKAWRRFSHLPNREHVPDVRMLNAFRAQVGGDGLRQVNAQLLDPVIEKLPFTEPTMALIDATDLPASCSGFKKKHRPLFRQAGRLRRTHTQNRTEPVLCRLQEAHVSPVAGALQTRRVAGAAGQLGGCGQCFGRPVSGAQCGLLCPALVVVAGLCRGGYGLH